jgi:hypothetical protein
LVVAVEHRATRALLAIQEHKGQLELRAIRVLVLLAFRVQRAQMVQLAYKVIRE